MKNLIIVVAIFLSANVHADMLLGKYQGTKTQKAEACEIEVVTKYYLNNTPHPLNERVTVKVGGVQWELGHRAVVNEQDGTVRFNHSYFEQIQATPTGAKTLIMTIDHDNEPHAALSYHFIDDNYRDATKSVNDMCSGLQIVK